MAHVEESTEVTKETEAKLAFDEKEKKKETTVDETEASSYLSLEKKRPAPEHWEDESSLEHHKNDLELQVEEVVKPEEVGEGSLSDDKGDEQPENPSGNDHLLSVDTSSTPPIVPRKPVKKARTAYFIFAEEKRPELQKQNTGVGVAGMAKLIAQLWNSLSADEKKIYQDKATAEREQVAKEMQAWKDAGGVVEEPTAATHTSDPNALIFPAARIRKICKLDPEVKNLSKEALLLVCKAAELALSQLGRETVKVAQIQNRRKLIPDDVATVCNTREQFLFLREDIQDLARSAAAAQQQNAKGNNKIAKPNGKPQGRPITDFFAPKPSL
ncbi:hypothetical protein FisN_35Lh046 [Fistulifera solaris]|uniref:HMG box domain-containing protein n=1 Tax=Fistulifera solaris TaxID=1519565 RepID=A0A1Z5KPE9_FISSO|nr:hypothetical protein FisN_35Lh046 [Fistulifera solaris]|eukprot:GAX28190.1 hypothetical protein FisN_35Lh046 [Fistulifera solaris]